MAGLGRHGAHASVLRKERRVHLVDVVPDPPARRKEVAGLIGTEIHERPEGRLFIDRERLLGVARDTGVHVPDVRVFTWMVTRVSWFASLAMMSMPGMLPAKVTA